MPRDVNRLVRITHVVPLLLLPLRSGVFAVADDVEAMASVARSNRDVNVTLSCG